MESNMSIGKMTDFTGAIVSSIGGSNTTLASYIKTSFNQI